MQGWLGNNRFSRELFFGHPSYTMNIKTEEKTSHQLKFGDVTFPPQVRTHMRTNSRQTIISIHQHVHKAITCCTKVRWQDEYQKKVTQLQCKMLTQTNTCWKNNWQMAILTYTSWKDKKGKQSHDKKTGTNKLDHVRKKSTLIATTCGQQLNSKRVGMDS